MLRTASQKPQELPALAQNGCPGIRNPQTGIEVSPCVTSAFVASIGSSSQFQSPPPGVRHPFPLKHGNPQLCRLPEPTEGGMRPESSTKRRQAQSVLKGQVRGPLPPPTGSPYVSLPPRMQRGWIPSSLQPHISWLQPSQQIPIVESHAHHSSCPLPDWRRRSNTKVTGAEVGQGAQKTQRRGEVTPPQAGSSPRSPHDRHFAAPCVLWGGRSRAMLPRYQDGLPVTRYLATHPAWETISQQNLSMSLLYMAGASQAGALDPLRTRSISPALCVNLHTDVPILQLQALGIKLPSGKVQVMGL